MVLMAAVVVVAVEASAVVAFLSWGDEKLVEEEVKLMRMDK